LLQEISTATWTVSDVLAGRDAATLSRITRLAETTRRTAEVEAGMQQAREDHARREAEAEAAPDSPGRGADGAGARSRSHSDDADSLDGDDKDDDDGGPESAEL
jgi:hypothetical protein